MTASQHGLDGRGQTPLRRAARRAAASLVLLIAAVLLAAAPAAQAAATSPPTCTAAEGQAFIDAGRYERAIHEFACLIHAQPTEVEGYRGRIEAELMLGRYSDAVLDYTRVNAYVLPADPDAEQTILAGYADRLADDQDSITALTGVSFARWWFFEYKQAIPVLSRLLELRPNDVYGNLFRGSSRLLQGVNKAKGIIDLEVAIALAPGSPDVRYIVADAYTYGVPDPGRALAEATLALDGGLDTPRVHAILGAAYNALGDLTTAASHIERHIELVTTELIPTSPIAPGESRSLAIGPGQTYRIPVTVAAGETISISTGSPDFGDSIAVLLAPDGTPVVGSDDDAAYFADFDWVAEETGTYLLHVTSFEAVSTGHLVVTRN